MRKTAVVVFAQKVSINKASKAAYQRIILKECCLIPHKNFVSHSRYQIAKLFLFTRNTFVDYGLKRQPIFILYVIVLNFVRISE